MLQKAATRVTYDTKTKVVSTVNSSSEEAAPIARIGYAVQCQSETCIDCLHQQTRYDSSQIIQYDISQR